MTVISSKEFAINQKKYFDLAVNEEVVIKRGKNRYRLELEVQYPEQVTLEPDNDLRRAITAEELIKRIQTDKRRK